MAADGRIPDGNPFPGSYVYSDGHRNPQGIAWDPDPTGRMFVVEREQSTNDEINLGKAGGNHGCPVISGNEVRDGMEQPILGSGGVTWAPSGIAFNGRELLVTALGARKLFAFDEQAGMIRPIFRSGERYRDVMTVGDDIFVITTNRSPRAEGVSKDRFLKLSGTKR